MCQICYKREVPTSRQIQCNASSQDCSSSSAFWRRVCSPQLHVQSAPTKPCLLRGGHQGAGQVKCNALGYQLKLTDVEPVRAVSAYTKNEQIWYPRFRFVNPVINESFSKWMCAPETDEQIHRKNYEKYGSDKEKYIYVTKYLNEHDVAACVVLHKIFVFCILERVEALRCSRIPAEVTWNGIASWILKKVKKTAMAIEEMPDEKDVPRTPGITYPLWISNAEWISDSARTPLGSPTTKGMAIGRKDEVDPSPDGIVSTGLRGPPLEKNSPKYLMEKTRKQENEETARTLTSEPQNPTGASYLPSARMETLPETSTSPTLPLQMPSIHHAGIPQRLAPPSIPLSRDVYVLLNCLCSQHQQDLGFYVQHLWTLRFKLKRSDVEPEAPISSYKKGV